MIDDPFEATLTGMNAGWNQNTAGRYVPRGVEREG